MRQAWWRSLLFLQAGELVRIGRVRPLQPADAPPVPRGVDPRLPYPALDSVSLGRFWPGIFRVFFATGRPARAAVGLGMLRLVASLSAPFLLYQLLQQLPAAAGAAHFPWGLLALASLLGLSGTVSALVTQHWFFAELCARSIIVNSINRRVTAHALRLRRSARARMETGDLINHLGSDTDAVAESGMFLAEGFNAALTILATFGALAYYLGWAALAAAGALLLLTPFTTWQARRVRKLEERIMQTRDKRATLMSQVLHGIRVVKYHAWEPSVHQEVQGVRRDEIRLRMGIVKSDVMSSALWLSTVSVVAFAGFGTFVLLGGVLTVPLIFSGLALCGMLEEPFGQIARLLTRVQHAQVAMGRLHAYLSADERAQDERQSSPPEHALALRAAGVSVVYGAGAHAALADVDLAVRAGEAVAIVGPVGAGKSTLLRVLGSLQLPNRGGVQQLGAARPRVAYVPQEAFTLNASVRANIEFGATGDELLPQRELAEILDDSAFVQDLRSMPSGIETEIGERGVNLSGGQKQRVALARAAYHRPGLVLLDDPLSAVDVHTEDVLVERLLFGRLRYATRIVVTHRLTHLSRFDRVVFLVGGRIVAQGTYRELLQGSAEFRAWSRSTSTSTHAARSPELSEGSSERAASKPADTSEQAGRVTEDEDRVTGAVRWPVYRAYLAALTGQGRVRAPLLLAALLLAVAAVVALPLGQRVWFSRFTSQELQAAPLWAVAVFGALGAAVLLCTVAQRFLWMYRAADAGRSIHDRALSGVLAAPLRFFDSTPTGRILNRFARDLEAVDDELSWSVEQACRTLATTCASLLLILSVVPVLALWVLPILGLYLRLQHDFRGAAREARRLEAIARSPRYAHFKELVTGLDVIHGFGREAFFMERFYTILEHFQRMHWCNVRLNRWFGTRMGFVGGAVSLGTGVAIVCLAYAGKLSAGQAGLVLSYALGLWVSLNWAVRALSEVEIYMTQAERLQYYARLTPEPLTTASALPDASEWPLEGALEFRDVAVRYAPHLPRVLDGVSFRVKAGSKVGVIGRTGAGKSTLFQALFRFVELERGAILIDGVDLASVPLPRLRRALATIPQDPTLFAGSVRSNLDRFAAASDEAIWAALRSVHLDGVIRAMPGGLDAAVVEYGHNFSQGQRQLLCMARAILTGARIIVLDEATASVDVHTDRLIQETIRRELRDVTVLVIAHRLDTIADADMIVELSAGRVVSSAPPRARDSAVHDAS
jgi:ABC-type multidrug transport system fused ATPase/permease subunit